MNNNPYFVEKSPDTFEDFLTALNLGSKAPQDFVVLYRGQSNTEWGINSTLARPLLEVPLPLRGILAFSEMREYFERNRPSDELLNWGKEGIDPTYVLGKHLQQNPATKKIKDKPDDRKILTPFVDFSRSSLTALFFANYELQTVSELAFKDSLERKTDGAIFVVHVSKNWTKRSFQEVVEYIVFHLKENRLPPPVFWDPIIDLNDLDDEKAKRQQAEYIFHSSLVLVRHEASIMLADGSSAEEGMPPISYRVFGYTKVTMCIKRKTENLQAVNGS